MLNGTKGDISLLLNDLEVICGVARTVISCSF